MFPLDLYARVRLLPLPLHTGPRVPARIRLSLRPLIGEGVIEQQTSGKSRREIAKSRVDLSSLVRTYQRHCERSEAIHSFFSAHDGLLRRIRLRPKAGFGGQELLAMTWKERCLVTGGLDLAIHPL